MVALDASGVTTNLRIIDVGNGYTAAELSPVRLFGAQREVPPPVVVVWLPSI